MGGKNPRWQAGSVHGRLNYALGYLLVYAPLKNVLGFTTVGGPIPPARRLGLNSSRSTAPSGLNLKQLYGQTDAFLYVTVQGDGGVRLDCVGPATPNVEIKIDENGEVSTIAGSVCRLFQGAGKGPPRR